MRISIIDADLVGRKRHRFPNLVCMKLSGYYKERGDEVVLQQSYDGLAEFDRVYLAKVFTDTAVPPEVLRLPNVVYGGTGFFYDRAVPLPSAIEHHRPDYHLYDGWVQAQLAAGETAAGVPLLSRLLHRLSDARVLSPLRVLRESALRSRDGT